MSRLIYNTQIVLKSLNFKWGVLSSSWRWVTDELCNCRQIIYSGIYGADSYFWVSSVYRVLCYVLQHAMRLVSFSGWLTQWIVIEVAVIGEVLVLVRNLQSIEGKYLISATAYWNYYWFLPSLYETLSFLEQRLCAVLYWILSIWHIIDTWKIFVKWMVEYMKGTLTDCDFGYCELDSESAITD
jgi:hypothetical protein